MSKMYSISVVFGATGFGFERETNDLKEVEEYVDEYRRERTTSIMVWDAKTKQFIYWKKALDYKPIKDMLHAINRDFRYKERHA